VLPDFYSSVEKQNYQNKHLYIVDNSTNQDSFNLTQEILLEKDINYTYINNEEIMLGLRRPTTKVLNKL
jgi:GT2 family glycosyltransferase